MEEEDRELLEALRLDINSVLHVEDVLDYLRVRRILTANDDELIRGGRTRQFRCDLLLDTLPTRGATAFEAFVQALEFVTQDQQIDGYRRLIKKLKRRTVDELVSDSESEDDAVELPSTAAVGSAAAGAGGTATIRPVTAGHAGEYCSEKLAFLLSLITWVLVHGLSLVCFSLCFAFVCFAHPFLFVFPPRCQFSHNDSRMESLVVFA